MFETTSRSRSEPGSRTHLLSLPYDIRRVIYEHLFPQMRQIYLMATKARLGLMMRPREFPHGILTSCRQLHDEANDYFYNNYLFNILGYKKYCMAHYEPVYRQMKRFAKNGAKLEVLDNGLLSSTACVTLHAKGGHVEASFRSRQRGVPRDLKEVEDEAASMPDVPHDEPTYPYHPYDARFLNWMAFFIAGLDRLGQFDVLLVYLAVCLAIFIAWLIADSTLLPCLW